MDDFKNIIETTNRLTRIETILEQQNKVLGSILEQTIRTNGRVSALENWRSSLTGKITAISAMISGGVGIIIWVISTFLLRR